MIITLDKKEMKKYYLDNCVTEFACNSDCYTFTKEDKVAGYKVFYDGNIPISLTGTPIPEEVTIFCPYCGAEIHTWTGTGSVYCYNCGMIF